MHALRDFNLPKIVTSDVPIFLGLISDLFPLLDIPRKRDVQLEQHVRQAISELRLQPEENFILKVGLPLFLCTLKTKDEFSVKDGRLVSFHRVALLTC